MIIKQTDQLTVERVDELRVELTFWPDRPASLGDLERFASVLREAGALSQLEVAAEVGDGWVVLHAVHKPRYGQSVPQVAVSHGS